MENNLLFIINNIVVVLFLISLFFMLEQRFFSAKSVPVDQFRAKMTKLILIIGLIAFLVRELITEKLGLKLFLPTFFLIIGIYLLRKSLILSAEVESGKIYYTASCSRKIRTSFWFLFIGIILGFLLG